jgi:hypothetical protein
MLVDVSAPKVERRVRIHAHVKTPSDPRPPRPAFRDRSLSTATGVVLLENGRQGVGEGVGGVILWWEKLPNQARVQARDRPHRTQEVAGSSPVSSMRNRRKSAVFILVRAPVIIQALGPQVDSDGAPDRSLRGFRPP